MLFNYRRKKERERIAQEVDSQTQTSSPGGVTIDGKSGTGWGGKLSALLNVHRGSRANSRKSSRASETSEFSELGNASECLFPKHLLLLPGITGIHEDLQPSNLSISRNLPKIQQPLVAFCSKTLDSTRFENNLFYFVNLNLYLYQLLHSNFYRSSGPTLDRQDAVDADEDVLTPSFSKRKLIRSSSTAISLNTLQSDIKEAFTRRCSSLRRRVPKLESAHLPIPDGRDVSILITKPSPENTAPSGRQSEATVVNVLVHRESEEYQEESENS